MPTRILDVGTAGQAVCLVSDKDITLPARYFALSHCWGGQVPVQLIDKTLPHQHDGHIISMNEPFAFDNLPRSFQDAVTMTRRMQTRYLWIDSLCIFQNSKGDWYTESRSMVRIYGRAACVLAADSAINSEGGLFRARNPIAINPMYVRPPWLQHEYALVSTSTWDYATANTYLGRRAWALQERTLGNIVIHFGEQLWIECRHHDCGETFPAGIPDSARKFSPRFRLSEHVDLITQDVIDERSRLRPYSHWNSLIERFSRAALTYESDRLVAILGLCKFFRQIINKADPVDGEGYIAGLWASRFASQLLWSVTEMFEAPVSGTEGGGLTIMHGTSRGKLPQQQHGPSWSWASIEGPITMFRPLQDKILVEIRPVAHDCYELEEEQWLYPGHMTLHAHGYLHFGLLYYFKDRQQWLFVMHPRPMCGEDSSDAEGVLVGPPLAVPSTPVQPESEPVSWPELENLVQEAKDFFVKMTSTYQLMMALARYFAAFKDRPFVVTKASPDFDVGDFTDMPRDEPRPVFGLPIMDTGDELKFLNNNHSQLTLRGFSGLLLHPDTVVAGQYRRLGTFHEGISDGSNPGIDSVPEQSQLFQSAYLQGTRNSLLLV